MVVFSSGYNPYPQYSLSPQPFYFPPTDPTIPSFYDRVVSITAPLMQWISYPPPPIHDPDLSSFGFSASSPTYNTNPISPNVIAAPVILSFPPSRIQPPQLIPSRISASPPIDHPAQPISPQRMAPQARVERARSSQVTAPSRETSSSSTYYQGYSNSPSVPVYRREDVTHEPRLVPASGYAPSRTYQSYSGSPPVPVYREAEVIHEPTPAPNQENTSSQTTEDQLLADLNLIESILEEGISDTSLCHRVEDALNTCFTTMSENNLMQHTERLNNARCFLSGIKESLIVATPPSPMHSEVGSLSTPYDIPPEPRQALSIGHLSIPSERDLEHAQIDRQSLVSSLQEQNIPETRFTMQQVFETICNKASELNIDIPQLYAKIRAEAFMGRSLRNKTSRTLRNLAHILVCNEERAIREGNQALREAVNEKWKIYLPALESGCGDCNDPLTRQIESCYNNLTAAPERSFEERLHVAARKFRDETFEKACSQYMRDSRRHFDQASALPFFKGKLCQKLGLSPAEDTYFEEFCTRCGYGNHIDAVERAFNRQCTAKALIEHFASAKDERGIAVLSRDEIIDFLHQKSGVDKQEIQSISAGLDEDGMPTGNEISREALVMMVIKNLDKPLVI